MIENLTFEQHCPCEHWKERDGMKGYCELIGEEDSQCQFGEALEHSLCLVWLAVHRGMKYTGFNHEILQVPRL